MKTRFRLLILAFLAPWLVHSQTVNSGSNGSDGIFNPSTNTVVDMADHPDGIYQFIEVDIPAGVTITFKPNVRNTPVVWLVQSNVFIDGRVDVSGNPPGTGGIIGGSGGPGGWSGGNGGSNPTPGQGLGGGSGTNIYYPSGKAFSPPPVGCGSYNYGNQFLLPLLGGSGGGGVGGNVYNSGGGGGGGSILIACSGQVLLNGVLIANGGDGGVGGGGSGGSVRIVARDFSGTGILYASGGTGANGYCQNPGRIRIDVLNYNFGGGIAGQFTRGFQPIILPVPGEGLQISIASVGGISIPANPTGSLGSPDVILSAQQAPSIPVVVQCTGVPLNTTITVTANSAYGVSVSGSGLNSVGTVASSAATIYVPLPRGSGILAASATVPVTGNGVGPGMIRIPRQGNADGASPEKAGQPTRASKHLSELPYSDTGLTTDGERIAAVEAQATVGGPTRTVYVTESGKRIPAPSPTAK